MAFERPYLPGLEKLPILNIFGQLGDPFWCVSVLQGAAQRIWVERIAPRFGAVLLYIVI